MRTCLLAALLAAAVPAQQNDFAGIVVRAEGVTQPPSIVLSGCGDTFQCTPYVMPALAGDDVKAMVMGTLNGFYVLMASLETQFLICASPGIPGLVNSLILFPGPGIVTIRLGLTSLSDSGRCNGGTSPLMTLFTIPVGLPAGSFALQAIASTPLSAGGTGLAFSRAVQVDYQ